MTTRAYTTQNRDTAERVFSEVLNDHDLERIPDYYAADCRFYGTTDRRWRKPRVITKMNQR